MRIQALGAALLLIGTLGLVTTVLAHLPAWVDFSVSVMASVGWCYWLQKHDLVEP